MKKILALKTDFDGHTLDELLELARNGNRAAFDQLVDFVEDDVLRTAIYLTQNLDDARDVAQDVYVKLLSKVGSINDASGLRSWARRVTINTARDHYRKSRFLVPIRNLVRRVSPPDPAENVQIQSRILASLATLSFSERAVFVLYEIHALKTREIAGILNCKEVTVRSHLHNARSKLRRKLHDLRGRQ